MSKLNYKIIIICVLVIFIQYSYNERELKKINQMNLFNKISQDIILLNNLQDNNLQAVKFVLASTSVGRIGNLEENISYSKLNCKNLREINIDKLIKSTLMCYPYFRQVPRKITQPFDILAS